MHPSVGSVAGWTTLKTEVDGREVNAGTVGRKEPGDLQKNIGKVGKYSYGCAGDGKIKVRTIFDSMHPR